MGHWKCSNVLILIACSKGDGFVKIVAIVPIKLNNERLPGKNLRLLGGRPLVSYCLKTLLSVEKISSIYVYCSNDAIVKYLPRGVEFLRREPELDLPSANFTQIFEAFSNTIDADVYVYAHATAPYIKPETINSEIEAVLSGEFDSAFCAERIQDFLWSEGNALNFNPENIPRSQELPVVYRETSGVYVFKKEVFECNHRRVGVKPYIVQVGRQESIDINTIEDFYFAEMLLKDEIGENI